MSLATHGILTADSGAVLEDAKGLVALLTSVADVHLLVPAKDQVQADRAARNLVSAGVVTAAPQGTASSTNPGKEGEKQTSGADLGISGLGPDSRPTQLPPHKILFHSTEVNHAF